MPSTNDLPFPVPAGRFDQKQEMFKRASWDEKIRPLAARFYREVDYREDDGYRKIDYALRNASWNLEWGAALGNSRSNSGLYAWEGVPAKIQHFVETGGPVTQTPAAMSRAIKAAAGFFGADLVGICRLHPNWVYSHEYNLITGEHYPLEVPAGCDRAVVMAVAMDYEAMRSAPTGVGGGATGLGYSQMAFVANLLAAFIRGLGYRAVPCGNDTALSIPLAMAGGLGEASRMGLLITRQFGPRVRLCKVFTDLPLARDRCRPFGVEAFCRTCKKCAVHCPSHAIPHGEKTTEGPSLSNQSGILKWYVNPENCFSFWAANRMDCSTCIRVCPYNKPGGILHAIVPAVSRRTSLFNAFFAWLDDRLGYGTEVAPARFWGRF
ncbi:MAG: reductive dehalogenase [Desulfobacterales bacterium]|nr:MAG: reductive dehalogenase [Desulfobacterales bacterium]